MCVWIVSFQNWQLLCLIDYVHLWCMNNTSACILLTNWQVSLLNACWNGESYQNTSPNDMQSVDLAISHWKVVVQKFMVSWICVNYCNCNFLEGPIVAKLILLIQILTVKAHERLHFLETKWVVANVHREENR